MAGRAAANVRHDDGRLVFSDILGQLERKEHIVMPSPPTVELRNVALSSPIMYDAKKAKEMDWMDAEMGMDGLGDIEVSCTDTDPVERES